MEIRSTAMKIIILCIAIQTDIGGAAGRGGRIKGLTSLASRGSNAWKAAVTSGTIYGGIRYARRRRFQRNEAPSFCENFYEADSNDTVYGVFVCPLMGQSDDYSWCCGAEASQRCCSFFDDAGRTAGVAVGCIMGIFLVMSFIFFCHRHGAAILDIRRNCAAILSFCSGLFRCRKHQYRRNQDEYNVTFENGMGITDAANVAPRTYKPTTDNAESKANTGSACDGDAKEIYSVSNPHAHPELSDSISEISLNFNDTFSLAYEADITDSIWTDELRNSGSDSVVLRRGSGESRPSIKRSLSDLSKSARQHRSLEITTSCVPPPYDVAAAANYGQDPETETEVSTRKIHERSSDASEQPCSNVQTTV